jgi:hypothetical protein
MSSATGSAPTAASLLAAAVRNRHAAVSTSVHELSWAELERRTREVGNGFLARGLPSGAVVGFSGRLRVEQLFADLGALAVGVATLHGAEAVAGGPRCSLVIADDARSLVLRPGAELVTIDEPAPPGAIPLDLLAAQGVAWAASHLDALDAARAAVRPSDVATFADGEPLTHHDLVGLVQEAGQLARPGDRVLLGLPLSSTAARVGILAAASADATVCLPRRGAGLADALRAAHADIAIASAADADALADELDGRVAPRFFGGRLVRNKLRLGLARGLRLLACPSRPRRLDDLVHAGVDVLCL